jgi:hypothetical protein
MTTSAQITTDFNFRTKDGIKRQTVSVEYAVPTAAGCVELLNSEDPKVVALVCETIQSVLTGFIRGHIDSDAEFNQATLEALIAAGKISYEAIANLPKSERSVLTKEDLEAFAKHYIEIMPQATGKSVEKVTLAANLFVERFKRVAGDNTVLSTLREQLGTYVEAAGADQLEAHEKVIAFLANKVDELLSVKVTADAL